MLSFSRQGTFLKLEEKKKKFISTLHEGEKNLYKCISYFDSRHFDKESVTDMAIAKEKKRESEIGTEKKIDPIHSSDLNKRYFIQH